MSPPVRQPASHPPPKSIRPPRLREGDEVAVVATSWGGPHTFPEVFDAGVAVLRGLGLTVRAFPSTRRSAADLRAHPQARADDLNAAFADPRIAAVISSIGGDDSARILPFVDIDIVRANPKILLGFSDTATQLFWINQQGLVTFNGPSVMAGFAQAGHFPELIDHVRALLFEPTPTYDYRPYGSWVDSYPRWGTGSDPTAIGDRRPADGWHWINGSVATSGPLVGGCIEVLESLKGSLFWPGRDWWSDRVLFLETSEEQPTIEQVRCWLFNYGVQGVFEQLSGLVFGRARGYSDDEKRHLDAMICDVVVDEFGADHLVIVTNMDFGHTDPQWIMPLGVRAELDPQRATFRLLEPAVH